MQKNTAHISQSHIAKIKRIERIAHAFPSADPSRSYLSVHLCKYLFFFFFFLAKSDWLGTRRCQSLCVCQKVNQCNTPKHTRQMCKVCIRVGVCECVSMSAWCAGIFQRASLFRLIPREVAEAHRHPLWVHWILIILTDSLINHASSSIA